MTANASLSQDQQQYFEAAKSLLDKDKLKSLLFRLTDIHSPTGSTEAACSMLVEHIRDTLSVDAKVMSMAGESAAGYARLKGEGGGANLCYTHQSIRTSRAMKATDPGSARRSPLICCPRRRWWTIGFWLGLVQSQGYGGDAGGGVSLR